MSQKLDLVLVGIGGQGVISTARIVSIAGLASGLRVKGIELVGAAQRGGTVVDQVRIGKQIHSPILADQSADALLAFEPVEGLRIAPKILSMEGIAIVNTEPIYPLPVLLGQQQYPETQELIKLYNQTAKTTLQVDATKIAVETGSPVLVGSVLLGVLAASMRLPFEKERIVEAIKETFRGRMVEQNIAAYNTGYSEAKVQD